MGDLKSFMLIQSYLELALIVNILIICTPVVSGELELTILHTNDVHARVEQFNERYQNCSESEAAANACFGGVARRATAINQLRRNHDNVLLLDAGDQFQGTNWFTYYKGLESSYFMNKLGYDAMVVGSHEFDHGVSGLMDGFMRNVTFPILSANIDTGRSPEFRAKLNPSITMDFGQDKIGIIGYTSKETVGLVSPEGIDTITFLSEIPSIQEQVDKLKQEGINKIIVLGCGGYNTSQAIARAVTDIDVMVDGRTESFLYSGLPPSSEVPDGPYPTIVNNADNDPVLIVLDFRYGKYLGLLTVTFDDAGRITHSSGNPVLLDSSYEQDQNILMDVKQMRIPLVEMNTDMVGTSLVDLVGGKPTCRQEECNLGNLVTDAILDLHHRDARSRIFEGWTDASIAVWNGGAIRASVRKGPITESDIMNILPFPNKLRKITIRGETLMQMLEHSWSPLIPGEPEGMFLQVSGLRVTYNLDRNVDKRVLSVMVRCAKCNVPAFVPLDLWTSYDVLTSDYIVDGGDGYTMIRKNLLKSDDYEILVSDALRRYIKTHNPIYVGLEGRIRFDMPSEALTFNTALNEKHTEQEHLGERLLGLWIFLGVMVGCLLGAAFGCKLAGRKRGSLGVWQRLSDVSHIRAKYGGASPTDEEGTF